MDRRRSYLSLAFFLLLISIPALLAQNVINCSSNDMKRHFCSMGRFNNARLVNQKSGSPCIQGRTWGIQGKSIWVDRGCRADFQLMGGRFDRGGQTIRCSSNNMRRQECRANGRIARVQLARQYSGSPCTQGRTWGYNGNRIWVDRGCRADFTIWYR